MDTNKKELNYSNMIDGVLQRFPYNSYLLDIESMLKFVLPILGTIYDLDPEDSRSDYYFLDSILNPTEFPRVIEGGELDEIIEQVEDGYTSTRNEIKIAISILLYVYNFNAYTSADHHEHDFNTSMVLAQLALKNYSSDFWTPNYFAGGVLFTKHTGFFKTAAPNIEILRELLKNNYFEIVQENHLDPEKVFNYVCSGVLHFI